jgi:ketosteroid isomerase-like protein
VSKASIDYELVADCYVEHRRADPRIQGESLDAEVLGLYEVREGKFFRAQMFYFDSAAVARYLEAAQAETRASDLRSS